MPIFWHHPVVLLYYFVYVTFESLCTVGYLCYFFRVPKAVCDIFRLTYMLRIVHAVTQISLIFTSDGQNRCE